MLDKDWIKEELEEFESALCNYECNGPCIICEYYDTNYCPVDYMETQIFNLGLELERIEEWEAEQC